MRVVGVEGAPEQDMVDGIMEDVLSMEFSRGGRWLFRRPSSTIINLEFLFLSFSFHPTEMKAKRADSRRLAEVFFCSSGFVILN